MIKGQLQKHFMRAASRVVLTVLVPASLLLSSCAYADTHALKNTVSASASDQTFEEVPLRIVKDLDGLVKKYPVLMQAIRDIVTDNKDTRFAPTDVYVAELKPEGKSHLLFMALSGPMYCGSGGCGLTVYLDTGDGYKKALDALISEGTPVYTASDQASLVTCGRRDQRYEWQLKDGSFDHPAPYAKPQKLDPCK